jgi:hypothetical protein
LGDALLVCAAVHLRIFLPPPRCLRSDNTTPFSHLRTPTTASRHRLQIFQTENTVCRPLNSIQAWPWEPFRASPMLTNEHASSPGPVISSSDVCRRAKDSISTPKQRLRKIAAKRAPLQPCNVLNHAGPQDHSSGTAFHVSCDDPM